MAKRNKYNSALVQKAKEDMAYEKQQKQLKEEHDIKDENVVVVEKSNNYKFTINNLKALFQLTSRAIIIILTIIGLMGLIFPSPRAALFTIIYEAVRQLQDNLEPLITIIQDLSRATQDMVRQLQEYIK